MLTTNDIDFLIREISIQLHNYESRYGVTPNQIILGLDLYRAIKTWHNIFVIEQNNSGEDKIFGTPVSIDYLNTRTSSVGYFESVNYL